MVYGQLPDIQLESRIIKNNGAVGFGHVEFKNQPNSGDTITLGGRIYGFGSGGDITITIGGSLSDTLDNAVTAINADGSTRVEVRKGSGSVVLSVLDIAGASESTFVIAESTSGVRMEVSAATSKGNACPLIKVLYDIAYTITAQDVLALAQGARTGQIVIASLPRNSAPITPSNWIYQIKDANGVIQTVANITLQWSQVNTNQYALFLTDSGPDLAASDIINLFVIIQ